MADYQDLHHACKQQAQIWKQEARSANDTIAQIYQLCTGKTGEPGNWNGAEPVRKVVEERDALRKALQEARSALAALDHMNGVDSGLEVMRGGKPIKAIIDSVLQ